jgi:hypothetical protein
MNRLPDRSHAFWLLHEQISARRRSFSGVTLDNLGGVDATDVESNCETDLIKYPPHRGCIGQTCQIYWRSTTVEDHVDRRHRIARWWLIADLIARRRRSDTTR